MKYFFLILVFAMFGNFKSFAQTQKDKKPGGVPSETTRYVPEDRSGNTGGTPRQVEEVVIRPNATGNGKTVQTTEKPPTNGNGSLPSGGTKKKTSKPVTQKTPTAKKSTVAVCTGNWKQMLVCTVVQAVATTVVDKLGDWIDEKIQEHFYQDASTPDVFNGQMTILNSRGQQELVTVTINHSLTSQGSVYSVTIVDSSGGTHTGRTSPMTDTN
mgnify:CR=1 FL=1